jgi:arylsulfatase A-like enzyme
MVPALLHATDLVPTFLELAGAEHPSKQAGSKLAPLTGKSLVPLLSGAAESVRTEKDWIGEELFGCLVGCDDKELVRDRAAIGEVKGDIASDVSIG